MPLILYFFNTFQFLFSSNCLPELLIQVYLTAAEEIHAETTGFMLLDLCDWNFWYSILRFGIQSIQMSSSAQDPFYIVKEEIQESIDKLLSNFHRWERIPIDSGEKVHLTKELLAGCESIEWQVDELDKTIDVAARDPSRYGTNKVELEKRRRWTSNARIQVSNVKKPVMAGKGSDGLNTSSVDGMRRELMRVQNSYQTDRSNQYTAEDNDDFISSESDRQLLLIKQQDAELDELSASVERIGGVGLTIHEELLAQEKIIDEFGNEMESTSNRLDFVQKKVGMVMKKAGAKGQIMMILFLLLLFIILFVLVFFT